MKRVTATLPLEEGIEVVERCSICGEASTASLAGTDGWCTIERGARGRYVLICTECQKEDRKR